MLQKVNFEDANGRRAIEVADAVSKLKLQEIVHFMKRFDMLNAPTYLSNEASIYLAKDSRAGDRNVAIKFMKHKEGFERELSFRKKVSSNAFIPIYFAYDSTKNEEFKKYLELRRLEKYSFAIVMPACVRTLNDVLISENIAGRFTLMRLFQFY